MVGEEKRGKPRNSLFIENKPEVDGGESGWKMG